MHKQENEKYCSLNCLYSFSNYVRTKLSIKFLKCINVMDVFLHHTSTSEIFAREATRGVKEHEREVSRFTIIVRDFQV